MIYNMHVIAAACILDIILWLSGHLCYQKDSNHRHFLSHAHVCNWFSKRISSFNQ